jgi:hypothetical protein
MSSALFFRHMRSLSYVSLLANPLVILFCVVLVAQDGEGSIFTALAVSIPNGATAITATPDTDTNKDGL